jgi:methylenetetrahydrofolate--tRNA-(uracil-5-)-methyltransferase
LSPLVLNHDLSLKKDNRIFFAGQIIGTEGYTESVAGGLYAGIQVFLRLEGLKNIPFPTETAIGALMNYVTSSEPEKFSPMNINLSLFHNVIKTRNKRKKYEFIAKRSLETLEKFITNFPELITIAKEQHRLFS